MRGKKNLQQEANLNGNGGKGVYIYIYISCTIQRSKLCLTTIECKTWQENIS